MSRFSITLVILHLIVIRTVAQDFHIYINPASKVVVYGSTNVNHFTFKYTEGISIDKLVHVTRENSALKLSNCIIDLKVRSFDSGNSLMNRDFRTMMNEQENPFISVALLSITPEWKENGGWEKGKVEIEVEINEIKKRYTIQCHLENPESLFIHGKQIMLLTAFDLEPPKRMMGMVRVSEVVELDLALRFGTDK